MSRTGRPVVIAADGGGTKTDLVVVSTDGELLSHARGAGARPQIDGPESAMRSLTGLRDEALARLEEPVDVVRAQVYLAGMDFPSHILEAEALLADWPVDVVDNDIFALLRSGTAAGSAVAVVCGTGINAVGVRQGWPDVRFPALGEFSGDWGGGTFLGGQALWHAVRSEDGRGPATALQAAVSEALGHPRLTDAIEALYGTEEQQAALGSLCPVLFDVAEAGDAVAMAVVDRLADELVTMAVSILARLELAGAEVPVVLGGGVLAARRPQLMAGIDDRMRERAPHARTELVTAPPVLGAGLLALGAIGAGAAAERRYEAEVLTRNWSSLGVVV
jgi:N-acetylglucosamine kinase-like BadF-type ATPase